MLCMSSSDRRPWVCGIASLGIDHTSILGDTIEKIAWQKGGIFKVRLQYSVTLALSRLHFWYILTQNFFRTAPLECNKVASIDAWLFNACSKTPIKPQVLTFDYAEINSSSYWRYLMISRVSSARCSCLHCEATRRPYDGSQRESKGDWGESQ